MVGLKSETNLEKGGRHQKIQITNKVCDQSTSQKLKSPLMYGIRVIEMSYGETRGVQKPNHSTANTYANKPTQMLFPPLKDRSLPFWDLSCPPAPWQSIRPQPLDPIPFLNFPTTLWPLPKTQSWVLGSSTPNNYKWPELREAPLLQGLSKGTYAQMSCTHVQ